MLFPSRTSSFLFNTRLVLLCIACTLSLASQAAERVGDFALLDEQGRFHQLSRYQHRQAVVLLAFDQSCAASVQAASKLADLQQRFAGEIDFLAMDVAAADRSERQAWELGFPALADEMRLVAESLNISQSGEVLVFNPQRMSLFYRGAAGDELAPTLQGVIDDEISDTVTTDVAGCDIAYSELAARMESPPDYAEDIAPIVLENCAICHRYDGAGPFPFDSYLSLLGWSPMVREVILNKRMPPMQVDPEIGGSASAHEISAAERQTLLHWMAAGAPRDDSVADPLEAFTESQLDQEFEWQLGEPDFVVAPPPNVVPSVGIQDYEYLEVELPFDEDKWVRAFQYSPGDERVLHHLMTFIVPPDEDFWGPERKHNTAVRRFLGSFIPGTNPATVFPEDSGVLIPAGHKLALQFHYVTNGVEIDDETRIGLYFSDRPLQHEILTRPIAERFTIAPGDSNHPIEASFELDQPVSLLALRARMNYRGKSMQFEIKHPGGEREVLFSVPAYNYGWQPHYWLDEPRTLPAGTTVTVSGAFDNSLSNPFNPDPREEVSWGLESWQEMFTGYITYIALD